MKGVSEAAARPVQRVRRRGVLPPVWGTVLLAVALSLSGCAYFNTFYHARHYYSQAEKAEKNAAKGKPAGNASDLYKKSIDKCKKLIENYPGSKWQDDAHLLLAKAYYGRGDYLSAENTLEEFTTKFPKSELYPEALDWQGRTAYAKEDYEQARRVWKNLLDRFPDYENREGVEFQMAESLWKDKREDEAEPALAAYLKANPKGNHAGQARLALGQLLEDQKRYKEATEQFTEVADRAPSQEDRRAANLLLGESLEAQGKDDDALDLYVKLATSLDPDVFTTRMSSEDLATMVRNQKAAAEQARQDSLANLQQIGVSSDTTKTSGTTASTQTQAQAQAQALSATTNPNQVKRRNPADPRDQQLAQVLLREGRVRARLGQPYDALEVFKQVLREWPRTPYAAEAQYRIGYTYEVVLEDFDQAQKAYADVAKEGVSTFRDDAARRAKNLTTVKNLMATASADTAAQAQAAAAEARFMRAELYLFQQENPQKAIEEYKGIETQFKGSEYAAKAGLALAWVASQQGDSAAANAKYAEVAQDYPRTEYGRRASEILYGPEPEPDPIDFAGPTLDQLRSRENLASVQANLPPAPTLAAADTTAGPSMAERVPPAMGPPAPPKQPVPQVPNSGSLADFVSASREKNPPPGTNPGTNPQAGPSTPPPGNPAGVESPFPSPGTTPATTADGVPTPIADGGSPATTEPVRPAGDSPTPASTLAPAPGAPPTPAGETAVPAGPNPGASPEASVPAPQRTGEGGLPDAGPDIRARIPVVQPMQPAAGGREPEVGHPEPDAPVANPAAGLNPLLPVAAATGDSAWTPRRYSGEETVPGHLMKVPRDLYLDPSARPGEKPAKEQEGDADGKPAPKTKESAKGKTPPKAKEASGRSTKSSAKSEKPAAESTRKKKAAEDPPKESTKADSTSGKGDR